jgi:hypothetical protein
LAVITPVSSVVIMDLAVILRGAHSTSLELLIHSLFYKYIILTLKANKIIQRKIRTPKDDGRDPIIVVR